MTDQEKVTEGTPIPDKQVTEKTANDTGNREAYGETVDNPPSNPNAISKEEAEDTDLSTKDFTIQTDAEELEVSDGTNPHDKDADGEIDDTDEDDSEE